jgi:hypothetical protein
MAEFTVGVNLPWLDYGQDFGANAWQPGGGLARPERRERLRRVLADLAESGSSLVRFWLFGDGRSGLVQDASGLHLDDCFFADLDAAAALLRESGLRALFVLLDFLWFAPVRTVNGVSLGGRRALVRDPASRADLLARVLAPLAARYSQEPAVAGWDLINEPEWATLGLGTLDPRCSISRREMRALLAEIARVFRREASQPLTVGLARARWLSLVDGLDLDFHQVHWYEANDSLADLGRPVRLLGLDRPVLLGEFPSRGASLGPEGIMQVALSAGYSGALAWSALATDHASDGDACRRALIGWSRRLPADTGLA